MSLTFEPWIGEKYQDKGLDGLNLLILGESHYGEEGTERPGFTRHVVKKWGQENRHRFFTTTAKAVLGLGSSHISNSKRAEFWDRVAFANYIQTFVAEDAESRKRPTEEMWQEAKEAFPTTIEKTTPDAIVVLGIEVARRLPQLPGSPPHHAIKHPSQYFRYEQWQPELQKFLQSVRTAV